MAPALGAGYRRFESSRPENKKVCSLSVDLLFLGVSEDENRAIVKRETLSVCSEAARSRSYRRPAQGRVLSPRKGMWTWPEGRVLSPEYAKKGVTHGTLGITTTKWPTLTTTITNTRLRTNTTTITLVVVNSLGVNYF